jgi:hypothetical protein
MSDSPGWKLTRHTLHIGGFSWCGRSYVKSADSHIALHHALSPPDLAGDSEYVLLVRLEPTNGVIGFHMINARADAKVSLCTHH